MATIPRGAQVVIVATNADAREYSGSDALVVGELADRNGNGVLTYVVRHLETGRLLQAQPGSIRQIARGYANSPSSWAACGWKPNLLRKT